MELPNNPGEASAYANGVADARRAADVEISDLKASLAHMGGHLEIELEEADKLRAENAKLRAEVASLKAALAVRADNDRLIREFSEQRESDEPLEEQK